MTASEKLKTLAAHTHPTDEERYVGPSLLGALPQIVAVVEAAERLDNGYLLPIQRHEGAGNLTAPGMVAAFEVEQVDALVAALSALQEALS